VGLFLNGEIFFSLLVCRLYATAGAILEFGTQALTFSGEADYLNVVK